MPYTDLSLSLFSYILSHFAQRLQVAVAERSTFQAAQGWSVGVMLSTTTNFGSRAPENSSSRSARHHLQVAHTFLATGTLYISSKSPSDYTSRRSRHSIVAYSIANLRTFVHNLCTRLRDRMRDSALGYRDSSWPSRNSRASESPSTESKPPTASISSSREISYSSPFFRWWKTRS